MSERYLVEKKFIFTLFALIVTTGLLVGGRIPASSFEQIVIWLSGIFVLGEAASGWVQSMGGRMAVSKSEASSKE